MSLTTRDKLLLFFQAMCGGFLFNVLILYGMKTTSAVSAGIISSIIPIVIFILAAILLREKITFQKGLAIIVVMLGLLILNSDMTSHAMEGALLGNCLVLLAVIPEALFTILSKSVGKKISEMDAVILINLFLFFLLWYRGLTKINANTAALFTGVMPISTAILACVFLNEPLKYTDMIGMLFVIAAIFIGCKSTLSLKSPA
jgi:drug/metabolite transporter (DMT)-like permease